MYRLGREGKVGKVHISSRQKCEVLLFSGFALESK